MFAASASAQTDGGAITGKVLDFDGRIVNGAPVEAKSVATGAVFKTTTAAGIYTLTPLPAGTYEVSVGVGQFERKTSIVQAGQTLNVDFRLTPAGLGIGLGTLGDGDLDSAIARLNRPTAPSGPVPRAPDGKPDLSGLWFRPTLSDRGKPELLPWAAAVVKERLENYMKDLPSARCLPSGVGPGATRVYRLVQTPSVIAMLMESGARSYREIFLDGRDHPKEMNPGWLGHSIGHWEGDTLVVDTVGFNDKIWLDLPTPSAGLPSTDMLHVIERYRRTDLGHLQVEITIDDRGAYKQPWSVKGVSDLAVNDNIDEFICNENNKDAEHLVGK